MRGKEFLQGMRDGVPIGLGYFAVSFSLGIAARNIGLNAWQGFLLSLFGVASAGEYAALTVIAAGASYWEMAVVTVIANARYLLMSFALSQRLNPRLNLCHRMLIGYSVTDELFAIAVARPKYLNPFYSYGSYLTAVPCWAIGTAVGVIAGNFMPERAVSAFSVALFGMFLAVIIPPAKENKIILFFIGLSFLSSYIFTRFLPILSGGSRTILLTLILSALAAAFFPIDINNININNNIQDGDQNGVESIS